MTTTPDADRQARRDALLHLTRRMLSGSLLPSERDLLATHVEEALRDGDQAREQLAAARAGDAPWIKAYREDIDVAEISARAHKTAAAEALERAERVEAGIRALTAQLQTIEADRDRLAGELDLATRNDQVTRREASKRREALATTLKRGPGADWYAIHAATAEAVRGRETAEAERDASSRFAEVSGTRAYRADADARRNRDAWRNARKRAAMLSAEVTRRAPLQGEYAARAIRAEGDAARARLVLRTHKRALLTILGMDPLRDWDDISNAVRGTVKARQAAEATLTAERLAQQRRVETTITAIRHAGLCADCEINLRAAIEAALGDPQPATEPDPCAHGCRQAADEHTRLSQEIDAEPECADPQGCHRVVPCNPGCAVTRQALADAMTKAQQPAEPLLRGNLPPLVISIDLSGAALADAIRRAARFGGGPR